MKPIFAQSFSQKKSTYIVRRKCLI